jgi:dipeptidyl aminopeptidase/acylaminoacyl peptidase
MRAISRKVRPLLDGKTILTGTLSQVEWAERIIPTVVQEFDRVATVFREIAGRQTGQDQADTWSVIAILEQKRAATMANDRAGYFIRDWQELNDQVRQMIGKDPGYREIKEARAARRWILTQTEFQSNQKLKTL